MQSNNLITLQNLMVKLRNDLTEEISTPEGNLQIRIDGNFLFSELKIKENITKEFLESEIPDLFNLAFRKMAERVKVEFEQHSAKSHLN
jgi:hypothetical protein